MTGRNSTALTTTFAVLALLSAAFFWGLNAIASKLLYRPGPAHFDAVSLMVARAVWSLPFFLIFALLAWPKRWPSRADWGRIVATAVCFGPGSCGSLALAAQYTSGAHVVMLMSLSPPFTAIVGAFVLRERIDALRIVALAVGIAGALVLALTHSTTGSTLLGDGFELIQVVCYSLMFVFTRGLGRRYSAFFVSGAYGTLGMLLLALAGAVTGRLASSARAPLVPDATTLWWFFGEIIVALTIYGQTAQAYALRALGAGITSFIGSYGTLIVGLIGAIVILGEALTPAGYAAAALLALALALALVPSVPANLDRAPAARD